MVLDGKTAAGKSYVTFSSPFDSEAQIQPNGIDLRIEKITEVTGHLTVPRDDCVDHSAVNRVEAPYSQGFYSCKAERHYLVDFYESISVPDGYCAIILPRSSLLRAGAFMTSALWDTGFTGQLGASLRPLLPVGIEVGARMCQVVFMQAKFSGHRYSGRYQGATSQTSEM